MFFFGLERHDPLNSRGFWYVRSPLNGLHPWNRHPMRLAHHKIRSKPFHHFTQVPFKQQQYQLVHPYYAMENSWQEVILEQTPKSNVQKIDSIGISSQKKIIQQAYTSLGRSCEALPNMWIQKLKRFPHISCILGPRFIAPNNSPARQWLRENERNMSLQIVNTFV